MVEISPYKAKVEAMTFDCKRNNSLFHNIRKEEAKVVQMHMACTSESGKVRVLL